jgi:hypothetical protein
MDSFAGNNEDPQSLHKYLYANCDPVNGIDPTGQGTLTDLLVTSAIIGGLAGMVIGGIRGGVSGAIAGLFIGAASGILSTFAITTGGIGLAAGINAIAGTSVMSASAGVTTAFALSASGSIAMDTLKIIRDKNASGRERLADGVCLIFDIAGTAFGAYKLGELPSLPSKASSDFGLPTSKEQIGTIYSEAVALARGETVIAREVTIETPSGVRTKVDLVLKNQITGKLRFVESKFGPSARYESNQKLAYPEIGRSGGTIKTPKLEGVGLPWGSKIGPTDVYVDWWQ